MSFESNGARPRGRRSSILKPSAAANEAASRAPAGGSDKIVRRDSRRVSFAEKRTVTLLHQTDACASTHHEPAYVDSSSEHSRLADAHSQIVCTQMVAETRVSSQRSEFMQMDDSCTTVGTQEHTAAFFGTRAPPTEDTSAFLFKGQGKIVPQGFGLETEAATQLHIDPVDARRMGLDVEEPTAATIYPGDAMHETALCSSPDTHSVVPPRSGAATQDTETSNMDLTESESMVGTQLPDVPAAVNEPTRNFFGTGVTETAVNEPTRNFFGTRATETAANEPTRNFFGTKTTETAANEPTRNFFGTKTTETAANEPTRNFFGTTATETAANEPTRNFFGTRATETAANEPTRNFFGAKAPDCVVNEPTRNFLVSRSGVQGRSEPSPGSGDNETAGDMSITEYLGTRLAGCLDVSNSDDVFTPTSGSPPESDPTPTAAVAQRALKHDRIASPMSTAARSPSTRSPAVKRCRPPLRPIEQQGPPSAECARAIGQSGVGGGNKSVLGASVGPGDMSTALLTTSVVHTTGTGFTMPDRVQKPNERGVESGTEHGDVSAVGRQAAGEWSRIFGQQRDQSLAAPADATVVVQSDKFPTYVEDSANFGQQEQFKVVQSPDENSRVDFEHHDSNVAADPTHAARRRVVHGDQRRVAQPLLVGALPAAQPRSPQCKLHATATSQSAVVRGYDLFTALDGGRCADKMGHVYGDDVLRKTRAKLEGTIDTLRRKNEAMLEALAATDPHLAQSIRAGSVPSDMGDLWAACSADASSLWLQYNGKMAAAVTRAYKSHTSYPSPHVSITISSERYAAQLEQPAVATAVDTLQRDVQSAHRRRDNLQQTLSEVDRLRPQWQPVLDAGGAAAMRKVAAALHDGHDQADNLRRLKSQQSAKRLEFARALIDRVKGLRADVKQMAAARAESALRCDTSRMQRFHQLSRLFNLDFVSGKLPNEADLYVRTLGVEFTLEFDSATGTGLQAASCRVNPWSDACRGTPQGDILQWVRARIPVDRLNEQLGRCERGSDGELNLQLLHECVARVANARRLCDELLGVLQDYAPTVQGPSDVGQVWLQVAVGDPCTYPMRHALRLRNVQFDNGKGHTAATPECVRGWQLTFEDCVQWSLVGTVPPSLGQSGSSESLLGDEKRDARPLLVFAAMLAA